MDLSVLVQPPVEPITVEQAFVELRLGMPGDDFREHPDYGAVLAKMQAATQHCENLTGRAFVQQTLRLAGTPDTLAASARARRCVQWSDAGFDLLRQPVQSIVSVSYLDADHVEQTVDAADYYLISGSVPQMFFAGGYALPALASRRDALRIDYVAGYPPGTPDEDYDPEDPPQHLAAHVPAPIKQAILLTLRLLQWEMTEGERASTTAARDALLWPYKLLRV